MSADILIVDDEPAIRATLQGILQDEGYTVRQAANSTQAYAAVGAQQPDLVILDIWLQEGSEDGLQILAGLKKHDPMLPILMVSGHGTIETAVGAIKQGAYDFIEKPLNADRLLITIERALETARLRRENEALRLKADGPVELIGDSPAMSALRSVLSRVAQTNSRVLLTGEPGSGKELAARAIHKFSKRVDDPFMAINCAILAPDRLESELFGTGGEGAVTNLGVLERADGGTLLLDEVADMPLETQGKIVRVLQEQRFQRVGGGAAIEVDVRIIASSSRDLQTLMAEGHFRQDLYYRLNVVPIEVPPLRARLKDVPTLAAHFAETFSAQSGIPPCTLSDAALAAMQAYGWPGNVRQLRNAIEWIMIMNGGASAPVRPDQLPPEFGAPPAAEGSGLGRSLVGVPLREAREIFERDYLSAQVRRFGGNISKTAQFVGMERSALHRKMKQLGIGGDAEPEIRKIA